MEKIVKIGGKDCRMKTSAALPRLYRLLLGREIFEDVHNMIQTIARTAAAQADTEGKLEAPDKQAQLDSITIEEDLAYIMHKHGDPSQPNSVEAWLAQFDDEDAVIDSRVVMEIIALWNHETITTTDEKKKKDQSTGE